MELEQVLPFLVFSIVAAITPGPSNILLTAVGMQGGIARGLPCLAGVMAGMAFLMVFVAIGVGQVAAVLPTVLPVMTVLGAGFLLWLAWKIAWSPTDLPEAGEKVAGFAAGAGLQLVNPKSWLVATSAAGLYLSDTGNSLLFQAFSIGVLFSMANAPCGFLWLAFGAAMRRFLSDPRRMRVFNILMGSLLAASVVMLVV